MLWFKQFITPIRRATTVFLVLLPFALAVVWPWSYFQRIDLPGFDTLNYSNEPTGGEIFIHPRFTEGRLRVRYCHVIPGAPLQNKSFGPRMGFYYQCTGDDRYKAGTFVERNVFLPIWSLLLLALLCPIVIFIRGCRYRRLCRREKDGLCLKCGYNLMGNLSGVCPECGERV